MYTSEYDVKNKVLILFFHQKCVRKDDIDSKSLDQRKTLQSQIVAKGSEENQEFEKQRTAAIAEVAKTKEVNVVLFNPLQ